MNIDDHKDVELRKRVQKTPDGGTALISDSRGFAVEIVGGGESLAITSMADWNDMHKKLKTGKLDFATVKKEHEVSRKNN